MAVTAPPVITRQQIRRGVFKSVAELEAAIETWLTERNAKPKPYRRFASVSDRAIVQLNAPSIYIKPLPMPPAVERLVVKGQQSDAIGWTR